MLPRLFIFSVGGARWVSYFHIAQKILEIPMSLLQGVVGTLLPALIKELSAQGCEAMVVAGGVIPQQDYGLLHEAGVKSVFGPGTRIPAAARTIIGDLEAALSEGDAQAASG